MFRIFLSQETLQPFPQTIEYDIEIDFLKHATKNAFYNHVVIAAHTVSNRDSLSTQRERRWFPKYIAVLAQDCSMS